MKMSNILLATAAAAALLASPAHAFDDRLEPHVDAVLRETLVGQIDVIQIATSMTRIILYSQFCQKNSDPVFSADSAHMMRRLMQLTLSEAQRKEIGAKAQKSFATDVYSACKGFASDYPTIAAKLIAQIETLAASVVTVAKGR